MAFLADFLATFLRLLAASSQLLAARLNAFAANFKA